MATKGSFILAILFIANPIMLLFFQNCSVLPQRQASSASESKPSTKTIEKDVVTNN